MKRRAFIPLIGAMAWSLAARAQPPAMPVIGFLYPTSLETETDRLRAFREGLKESGHVEGETVTIEYRSAEGQLERLPALAADLVHRQVAVLVVAGGRGLALAAQAATTTIPIVFLIGEDPVKLGLVTSLARPGGNMTGVNFFAVELAAKRLELLRDLVPDLARVVVLVDPTNAANTESTLRDVNAAAGTMRIGIRVLNASTAKQIDAAFTALEPERPDALFVGSGPLFTNRRSQLALLAGRHRIPAIYASRQIAEAGGLASYGSSLTDASRQMGVYAGRILKGDKPADLPVVQPTKFEFVINLMAARTIGLDVSPSLLARADEVIE
jgi:putative tryptophan/tyrosine transport system substrate-binding protein